MFRHIALSLCLAGAVQAAQHQVSTLPKQKFSTLADAAGATWKAEGQTTATIIDHARANNSRALRLQGEGEASATLQLAKPERLGSLEFALERWTGRKPFAFAVDIQAGGQWRPVLALDDRTPVGAMLPQSAKLGKETLVEAIRFRCTAPQDGGVIIGDLTLAEAGPMTLVAVQPSPVPAMPPALVRKTTPLLAVELTTQGNENPLTLDGVSAKATAGAGDIAALHLFLNGKAVAMIPNLDQGFSNLALPLASGRNILGVGAELKPTARVGGQIGLALESVAVSGKPQPCTAQATAKIGTLVRKAGDDGINSYRIPGLVTSKKGTLLAVYDIRYSHSGDLPADIDVGLSRSTDGGQTWEPMKVILDINGRDAKDGVGDPAILVDAKTGRIWVAALWAHNGKSLAASKPGLKLGESGQLALAYSDDDGLTWSEPRNVTAEAAPGKTWRILFNGPGAGITLRDGTLVFAAQYWDEKRMPWSTLLSSRDGGKSWHCGTGAKPNTTEAQVVELDDGSLMLNMRDNRGGSRSVATTRDLGETWTEHPTSRQALPEPVCQASILRIASVKDGAKESLIAFFNPRSANGRKDMTIQLSNDEGMTWKRRRLVNPNPCWGYSCMALVDPTTVGVLYESTGDLIFEKIRLDEIPEVKE